MKRWFKVGLICVRRVKDLSEFEVIILHACIVADLHFSEFRWVEQEGKIN